MTRLFNQLVRDRAPQNAQRPADQASDAAPPREDFRAEVLAGLARSRKQLPCKFFYDRRGSQLFDQICELPEYYLTRTELQILHDHASEMAELLGPRCRFVEYGSGSSSKTRLLLDELHSPASYVPLDISREHLLESAARICAGYPQLKVYPVCADYTKAFALPDGEGARRTVIYFPGSTIGNFDPHDARAFLRAAAQRVGIGGGMLTGVDLKKDPSLLHAAYNDASGITAAFNLNLLARINRELDGNFALDRFAHYALYNPRLGRIEMHLVSQAAQTVAAAGRNFAFAEGESIFTESSYKYTLAGFDSLAGASGWHVERVWTDPLKLFSVQYLTVCG